jgi:hypothetical protein
LQWACWKKPYSSASSMYPRAVVLPPPLYFAVFVSSRSVHMNGLGDQSFTWMYMIIMKCLVVVICFDVEQKYGVQVCRYCWQPTARVHMFFFVPNCSTCVGYL